MCKPGLVREAITPRIASVLGTALTLEVIALWGILSGATPPIQVEIILFLVHGMAAVLFALAATALLAGSGFVLRPSCALPFLAVALLVPFLGMIGALVIFLVVRDSSGNSLSFIEHPPPELCKYPKLRDENSVPLDRDSIAGILSRTSDPGCRLKAILLTLKLKDKDAVPLLRMGLKDRVDDIRLLAYSLLSRKEKTLYNRINSITARLKETESHTDARLLYQDLVLSYWDLVYCGLSEGEAARFLIIKAHDTALEGLLRYPDNAGLYFQLGRILLFQKNGNDALFAFQKAHYYGIAEQKLLPYFAEAACYERRFADVKHCVGKIDHGPYPKLSKAAGFWAGKAEQ
jgi:hypothetical protein